MKKLVGIGIGPANLSLAAMIEGSSKTRDLVSGISFLEKTSAFQWHEGQLFPGSKMQNSFVRDLVTLADPTNRYSFLSFLKHEQRLIQFLNTGLMMPGREEFVQYFRWIAEQLDSLNFESRATSIEYHPDRRLFETKYEKLGRPVSILSENIVIGIGSEPRLPTIVGQSNGNCVHVSEFLNEERSHAGSVVTVVGGSQSAAEVVDFLLQREPYPDRINWITRRSSFKVLDTGNFTREFYTPGYAACFHGFTGSAKKKILDVESSAESGISAPLLEDLYRRIYHLRHVANVPVEIELLPSTEVDEIRSSDEKNTLACHFWPTGVRFTVATDHVILCTGFNPRAPEILHLPDDIHLRWPYTINNDYSLAWDGPTNRKIFVQSMARTSHGLSDPNFTMVCHRNSVIINSIYGREIFRVDTDDILADWAGKRTH